MMYIVKIEASESGSRPPLQEWNNETPPDGYALCTEEQYATFYSTNPAGFVNITIEDNKVTNIEINQEAIDKYIEEHPYVEPIVEPTTDDVLNALIGYEV